MMRRDEMHNRVKRMIVENLRLKVKPEEISDDDDIFETLGLDSIDGLEIVVSIEKEFGISISSEEDVRDALRCISSIVDFVRANSKDSQHGAAR